MNREGAIGLLLVGLLLGGILLFARRPVTALSHASAPLQTHNPGNIRMVPLKEPRRYQNKETRRLEYNADGLLTYMEVTRDYAIT